MEGGDLGGRDDLRKSRKRRTPLDGGGRKKKVRTVYGVRKAAAPGSVRVKVDVDREEGEGEEEDGRGPRPDGVRAANKGR